MENIYIQLNSNLRIEHSSISTPDLYGIDPNSENIFYAFESQFTPYQRYVIGTLPGVDLVIQARDIGSCLQAIEIKLTALPDNATCDLTEDFYGCEIVVRPDTIVYLACSIIDSLGLTSVSPRYFIPESFLEISNWTEADCVISYIPNMVSAIDSMLLAIIEYQKPFLMQPIWKTQGKSPRLSEHCFDVFVWSNLAFTRLFVDLVKREINMLKYLRNIKRYTRTVIWLFKMLYDFGIYGSFDRKKIIDSLSYNTKNDKAFSVSGRVTNSYMKSEILRNPRVKKQELKNIILGDGHKLLSPERRLDAIIYNSPDLFD